MWYAQLDASGIFFMFLSMNDFLPGCLFALVVIKCFMIGVNVWWVYLAPWNIPRAISVLTLGNNVISYCIMDWIGYGKNSFLSWRFRKCVILDSWYIFLEILLHKAVTWLDQERLQSMVTPKTLWLSTSLTVWFSMEIGGHYKGKHCLLCLVVISIN